MALSKFDGEAGKIWRFIVQDKGVAFSLVGATVTMIFKQKTGGTTSGELSLTVTDDVNGIADYLTSFHDFIPGGYVGQLKVSTSAGAVINITSQFSFNCNATLV